MIYLKQSTASQEVPLGRFVDSTDGDSEETGLTINNTDIKIWKNGATTLANKNSGGATHIANGIYYAVLDATDTNTLGPLKIFVHVSGARPVELECAVLTAGAYDEHFSHTKTRKYFQLALRGDSAISADNAAEEAEINADGGSGAGSYIAANYSQQGLIDNYLYGNIVVPVSEMTTLLPKMFASLIRDDAASQADLDIVLTLINDDYGSGVGTYDPATESQQAIAANATAILEDTDATIPALIGGIGSGTGAALNFAVAEDNASAPLNGVTKKGTQAGTYTNTLANDASVHALTAQNDAGTFNIDWVYGFDVGTGRNASKFIIRAAMAVVGDTVTIQAYNFVTTSWDSRTTFTGTASQLVDVPLLSSHTGTGANAGKVYIRFVFSEADTGTININECYVQAQNLGQNAGYTGGYVYLDTTGGGTSGTTPFVNGIESKPCTTIAEAYTIAAAVGLKGVYMSPGSTVTLTQSAAGWKFRNGVISLNSQSIADAYFEGCYTIQGVSSGDDYTMVRCGIGTMTGAHGYFYDCAFKAAFTMLSSQVYYLFSCVDFTNTATACTFTYAASAELIARNWRGGIDLYSMGATNTTVIDGAGRVTIDATSTGGALTIRGSFPEPTGLAAFIAAGGTLTDNARQAEDQAIATVTGIIEANIKQVNDVTIQGTGAVGSDEWRAA